MNAGDEIPLEVEFSQVCQTRELEPVKTFQFVILEVESPQCFQSVESFVFNFLNV